MLPSAVTKQGEMALCCPLLEPFPMEIRFAPTVAGFENKLKLTFPADSV